MWVDTFRGGLESQHGAESLQVTVTLDEHYFSTTSRASRLLVAALKLANNDAAARKTIQHFIKYTDGLTNLAAVDNPTRGEVLALWYNHHFERAQNKLRPMYERLGLPFHEYENLLMHRLRRAREHGELLEKMRT
jgi:hypothetical protein